MQINNITPTNFNGLWAPVKVLKHEKGIYNKDKQLMTMFDMVYHPWVDETKEAVQEKVNKAFFGRSFSIWDTFDNHHKADLYQMNRVKVGNAIKHEDEAKLIEQGYTENLSKGTPSDEEFKKIYPNGAYEAFDISKMGPDRIMELANKYFPEV